MNKHNIFCGQFKRNWGAVPAKYVF